MMLCEKVDGMLRLSSSLDVKCFAGEHLAYFWAAAIPSLLLYSVLVPCAALRTLHRHRLRSELWSEESSRAKVYMFIYVGYHPQTYYWEFIILARKLFLNVVMLLSVSSLALGLLVLALFNVATILHMHRKPFRDAFLNAMESGVLVLSTMLIFVGLFLYEGKENSILLTVGIVVSFFLFCIFYVGVILMTAAEARRSSLESCCPCFYRLLDKWKRKEAVEPVREDTVSIEIPVVDQMSLSDIITNPLRKEKK